MSSGFATSNGYPPSQSNQSRTGDMPRARLASAEQQVMSERMPEALASAEAAEAALPKGSPDWLRAQDIAMQARAAIERRRKRK